MQRQNLSFDLFIDVINTIAMANIINPITRCVTVLEIPFALKTTSPRGVEKKNSLPRSGIVIVKLAM